VAAHPDLDPCGAVVPDHDPGDLQAADLATDLAVLDADVDPGVVEHAHDLTGDGGRLDRGRDGSGLDGHQGAPDGAPDAGRRGERGGTTGEEPGCVGVVDHHVELVETLAVGPDQGATEAPLGPLVEQDPAGRVDAHGGTTGERARSQLGATRGRVDTEVVGDQGTRLGGEQPRALLGIE
jgi:hypothetical protein